MNCSKKIAKEQKDGGNCTGCKVPIDSTTIRYLPKVLVKVDKDQACFTIFEDCALYFLKKFAIQLMKETEEETVDKNSTSELLSAMLDRECLFKVEVGMRYDSHVYTVKNVTEEADVMTKFSPIPKIDDQTAEDCSKNTRSSQKCKVNRQGIDQQSSTKILKK